MAFQISPIGSVGRAVAELTRIGAMVVEFFGDHGVRVRIPANPITHSCGNPIAILA